MLASCSGLASIRAGRRWASRPRRISPARSSTFRCLEIAGWLMAKGSASSATEASPVANRAEDRPAGGVGQGREGGVELLFITHGFQNYSVIFRPSSPPLDLGRRVL